MHFISETGSYSALSQQTLIIEIADDNNLNDIRDHYFPLKN